MGARYDTIGTGYDARRRPDPRIAKRIREALGDARTVVNVGAGAGSYEPDDLKVVAVEPSVVMARQRPQGLLPAALGVAERLPFADDAVDATMGILTLHHWEDVQAGAAEAIRVSRQRVVFLTIDPAVESAMWLVSDYVPRSLRRTSSTSRRLGSCSNSSDLGRAAKSSRCRTTAPTGSCCRSGAIQNGCSSRTHAEPQRLRAARLKNRRTRRRPART